MEVYVHSDFLTMLIPFFGRKKLIFSFFLFLNIRVTVKPIMFSIKFSFMTTKKCSMAIQTLFFKRKHHSFYAIFLK